MRCRYFFLLALAITSLTASAQTEQSVVPFIPEEESPFFIVRDPESSEGPRRNQRAAGAQASFPRNKDSERSAGGMFTGFFTEMFTSVTLPGEKKKTGSKLVVDPADFSLDDRREVAVDFTIYNKTSKLLRLDFPTDQRIEIVVKNPAGEVIERWSDDRAFAEQAGVVMINPDERIEYQEKIATREMVPGETYLIEASLVDNPDYTRTTTVTPTGKRELPPTPTGEEGQQPADESPGGEPATEPTQG
jgi:hypothetical protein